MGTGFGRSASRCRGTLCASQRDYFRGRFGQYGLEGDQYSRRRQRHYHSESRRLLARQCPAYERFEIRTDVDIRYNPSQIRPCPTARQKNPLGMAGNAQQWWREQCQERQQREHEHQFDAHFARQPSHQFFKLCLQPDPRQRHAVTPDVQPGRRLHAPTTGHQQCVGQ